MNKIVVVNDKAKDIKISDNIDFSIETYDTLFSITNINIEIKKDEEIYLFISSLDKKYKINIDVGSFVNTDIYIFENVIDSKIQYSFTLSESAKVVVRHFNKNRNSKQMIETNLIGADTIFNYEVKKICDSKETSDFYIHHCGENTISNLTGDIVSLDSAFVSVQLSTFVEEECIGAKTIQNLNILKLNDGKTELKPNLYIDNSTTTIDHNNNILNITDFVEHDFMINTIDDKKLKQEVIKFLERIGGSKNE